jgi:DNA repair photolyase
VSGRFQIYRSEAHSSLTETSGFIREAGFTHSLTPARNCTFGCTYCYVPTLGIYGGLKPEDWKRWGQFTTFKSNAPDLLRRQLRAHQVIYCSPLVDPYQPAEEFEQVMPRVLDTLIGRPPRVFTFQTRGPLILRDLDRIAELATQCIVRVSFSVTTNREDIRKLYEPHCATFEQRLDTIARLRERGIETYASLAPLLPADLDVLVRDAIEATDRDLVGDPLHVRAVKRRGATTREAARRIAEARDHKEWLAPEFQAEIIAVIQRMAHAAGRRFAVGPEGFSWLAQSN